MMMLNDLLPSSTKSNVYHHLFHNYVEPPHNCHLRDREKWLV